MRFGPLSILILLAACADDRPPAPTAEEAERLDEAEELLNQEAEAHGNSNEKGPEDRSSGPSD